MLEKDSCFIYPGYCSKNAAIFFAHVVEEAHVYGDFADPSLESSANRVADRAEARMKRLIDTFKDNVSVCDGKIYRGDIPESILQCAKEQGGDYTSPIPSIN